MATLLADEGICQLEATSPYYNLAGSCFLAKFFQVALREPSSKAERSKIVLSFHLLLGQIPFARHWRLASSGSEVASRSNLLLPPHFSAGSGPLGPKGVGLWGQVSTPVRWVPWAKAPERLPRLKPGRSVG